MKRALLLRLVQIVVLFLFLLAAAAPMSAGEPFGSQFLIGDQNVDTASPAIAYDTQRKEYLVVWYNDRAGCHDIYGQRLSWAGARLGPWFSIAAGCPDERRYPDVVYNPKLDQYLVVWTHTIPPSGMTSGSQSIRGQVVSAAGGLVGGVINISDPLLNGLATATLPAVDYSSKSEKYLVVWGSHTSGNVSEDIKAQVLSGAGAIEGSNFYVVQGTWAASHRRPDVAYNRRGNGYLVVWQQLDKGTNLYGIFGQLVHGTGALISTPFEILKSTKDQTGPRVAANPTATASGQYLVVWELQYNPGDRDVKGQLVNNDGTLDGPNWTISADTVDEAHPAVAANEGIPEYLVLWTRGNPLTSSTIQARTVSPTFLLGSRMGLEGKFADNSAVAAGASGAFMLTWEDSFTTNQDIWGKLWGSGSQVHLPMVLK